jgi:hypothetical protein
MANTTGKKFGGRQKGTPNKTTQNAKQAIEMAAEALGGHKRIVEWAKEDPLNERAFWTQLYPKIVPREIQADVEHSGTVQVVASALDEKL